MESSVTIKTILICVGQTVDSARDCLREIQLSEGDILQLAQDTTGQFRNILYCAVKKFRLTSTKFHQVLTLLSGRSRPGKKSEKGKYVGSCKCCAYK